jgi:general secretion pathway protein N
LFATRERPLFVPGRRGPAPVVPAPEPPPVVEAEPVAAPPPLTLQLRGVVAGPGIELAIFIDPASGETRRLTVGEEHEGWKLNALDRRRATFRRGEEETVLEILAPGLATSPITPPPPAEETASRRPTRDGRPKPPAPIGAP